MVYGNESRYVLIFHKDLSKHHEMKIEEGVKKFISCTKKYLLAYWIVVATIYLLSLLLLLLLINFI